MKSFKLEQKPVQPMTKNQLKFWIAVEASLATFFTIDLIRELSSQPVWWSVAADLILIAVSIMVGLDFVKKLRGGMYRHERKRQAK